MFNIYCNQETHLSNTCKKHFESCLCFWYEKQHWMNDLFATLSINWVVIFFSGTIILNVVFLDIIHELHSNIVLNPKSIHLMRNLLSDTQQRTYINSKCLWRRKIRNIFILHKWFYIISSIFCSDSYVTCICI